MFATEYKYTIPMLVPTLDLEEIAKIQPLTDSTASIFYLDRRMFAPEFTHKKCPWWHKLFRRFKWFRHYCRRCTPIKFESVTLPIIKAKLPRLNLQDLTNVMPLTIERNEDRTV